MKAKQYITLTNFINKENVLIHCNSRRKATKVLKALESLGIIRENGESLLNIDLWKKARRNTCITTYGGSMSKKNGEKLGKRIFEFKEVDLTK